MPSPSNPPGPPPREGLSAEALRLEKAEMRARLRHRRAILEPGERKAFSEAIVRHLLVLPAFREAARVHCFINLEDEVETDGIFQACLREGKKTCVPIIEKPIIEKPVVEKPIIEKPVVEKDLLRDGASPAGRLISLHWSWGDPLVRGGFGVRVPPPENRRGVALEEIDLVLLPGLAFDRAGGRLGYGKGYYDRFLSDLTGARRQAGLPPSPAIGVAFACQRVARVPMGPYDQRADGIVTEEGWLSAREDFRTQEGE